MATSRGRRSQSKAVRVMVVDDHPMWRDTVCQVLEHAGHLVVASVGDAEAAIEAARNTTVDVVLMDLHLPGKDGAAATAQLCDEHPGLKVLPLSSSDEPSSVVSAVKAGAVGYVVKTAGGAELAEAVRRVHAGELVFPPSVADAVRAHLQGEAQGPPGAGGDPGPAGGRDAAQDARSGQGGRRGMAMARLTPREQEVLALMAEGRSNQAICDRLFVSPKSVESHVRNIFTKLGLEPAPDDHRRVLAVLTYLQD